MFSLPVRIAIGLAALVLSVVALVLDSPLALGLFAVVGVVAVGYFRNGAVWLASRALRRGDVERMAQLLAETRKPEWLSRAQRPYYELMMGLARRREGEVSRARDHFARALAGRLRTDRDRSLAHAQLGGIALAAGELARAEEHVQAARPGAEGTPLAAYIEELATELRSRKRAGDPEA